MGTSKLWSIDTIDGIDSEMLSSQVNCDSDDTLDMAHINQVLFKGGHIYQHNVLCVNYTSYDIHHNQDIFNLNSDHHNVMMLLAPGSKEEVGQHHFCYACIIGVYHANIQYINLELKDYNSHWLDFLHISWFEKILPDSQHDAVALDMLQFIPMDDKGAFNFVHPAEILRGCYLIPAFAEGRSHSDSAVLSSIVKDSDDWQYYYVNR